HRRTGGELNASRIINLTYSYISASTECDFSVQGESAMVHRCRPDSPQPQGRQPPHADHARTWSAFFCARLHASQERDPPPTTAGAFDSHATSDRYCRSRSPARVGSVLAAGPPGALGVDARGVIGALVRKALLPQRAVASARVMQRVLDDRLQGGDVSPGIQGL